jgi:hypothetical protein
MSQTSWSPRSPEKIEVMTVALKSDPTSAPSRVSQLIQTKSSNLTAISLNTILGTRTGDRLLDQTEEEEDDPIKGDLEVVVVAVDPEVEVLAHLRLNVPNAGTAICHKTVLSRLLSLEVKLQEEGSREWGVGQTTDAIFAMS